MPARPTARRQSGCMGVIVKFRLTLPMLAVLCLAACGQGENQSTATTEPATTPTPGLESPGGQVAPRMSKDAFRDAAIGRTMDQVRQALGNPSNVEDQSEDNEVHWYYWPDKIQVYDADAGINIKGSASVTFDTRTKIAEKVGF